VPPAAQVNQQQPIPIIQRCLPPQKLTQGPFEQRTQPFIAFQQQQPQQPQQQQQQQQKQQQQQQQQQPLILGNPTPSLSQGSAAYYYNQPIQVV